MSFRILQGDVLDRLADLPDESVHCVITSPPYWGLRDYKLKPGVWGGEAGCRHEWGSEIITDRRGTQLGPKDITVDARESTRGAICSRCGAWRGCLGLEPTPNLFVEHIVEIFRELRRILRADGVCFLNLGDSYASGAGKVGEHPGGGAQGRRFRGMHTAENSGKHGYRMGDGGHTQPNRMPIPGLKPKDICGIPWRVAFALQEDGWWLRSAITWAKGASFGPFHGSPMPESVRDRPTRSWEMIFLLTRSSHYFWDREAVREPLCPPSGGRQRAEMRGESVAIGKAYDPGRNRRLSAGEGPHVFGGGRNIRDVWTICPQGFDGEFCTACKQFYDGELKAALRVAHVCPSCEQETADKYFRRWKRCRHCSHPVDGDQSQEFESWAAEEYADDLEPPIVLSKDWDVRRWCRCGRHDAWLSHFATFPPALVEPMIQAGTSEKGCCAVCGAPWLRVVKRTSENRSNAAKAGTRIVGKGHPNGQVREGHDIRNGPTSITRTTGWRPSCACGGDLVPCTVLDTFAGAGTTLMVALRLRRRALGIDLNPNYCEMARQRIVADAPLLNEGEVKWQQPERSHIERSA